MPNFKAEQKHEDLAYEIKNVLRKYSRNLSGPEILAIASSVVGQIIALQDQRTMTKDQALQIVMHNIELGNQNAIRQMFGSPEGSA